MTWTTRYFLPVPARLEPRTEWKTGRLADTDLLTLDEGARYATLHSKTEVTPGDFLRAAARGEIRLHAVCPREVTMQPAHSKHQPKHIAAGGLPTLPFTACVALSAIGRADWRTIDAFHVIDIDGEQGRCVGWQLADGELDIQTTAADCRVTGLDVHALADAFIEPAPETAPAVVTPESAPLSNDTTPPPLSTPDIADAFDGIGGLTARQWRDKLGDANNHQWVVPARAEKATAPKASTWWPIKLADLLIAREASDESLNRAFFNEPKLKPWLPLWQEKRRDRNAFGL